MRNTIFAILFLLISVNSFCAKTPDSFKKMMMTLYAIDNYYVDSVDENKIAESGIKAMIKDLDPHSAYMTAKEIKDMNEPLMGGFEGIGIAFNLFNDTLYVVEVLPGGPSEKVGVLPGDKILYIDGENVAGIKLTTNGVKKRLKGKKGTIVNIKVKRYGEKDLLSFRIIRDKIPINSVAASFMVDKNIGYIKITQFSTTTHEEFLSAFKKLKKEGMKKLIIDLQSNGGGLLSAATALCDELLPGNRCIVYTKGIHFPREDMKSTNKGVFQEGELAILVNEYSASASEITTGAIQDWDRGVVIGRRSFGKGLVQRQLPLPDGSFIKLTISRYYTPSGRCIQKPYGGKINYSKDLINRYNRGELIHEDSIHFPDSLKTYTLINHRTVYGGGGIMPDVFVPMDTTKYTALHKKLVSKSIISRFSLSYIDKNRGKLKNKYPYADLFVKDFTVNNDVEKNLLDYAVSEGIELTSKDSLSNKEILNKQLKAYMARDLFESSAFYKIMSPEDECLQKAISVLNDNKEYKRLLIKNKR